MNIKKEKKTMKKCNTQIMKEIKTLEEYRAKWIGIERANCTVS